MAQASADMVPSVLRCKKSCRHSGLSIIPDRNSRFYSIVKLIQQQCGHAGVLPHIHLIFPFLPQDIFGDVCKIISQCLSEFKPFDVYFNDIVRTHGSGKQYCYLVCDHSSKAMLVKLQQHVFTVLCDALKNGNSESTNKHSAKLKAKHSKKSKKKRKEKRDDRSCLEHDERNTSFNPHLSIGQMNEKQYKTMKNEVISAFQELHQRNDVQSDNNTDLLRNILHFKVSNIYIINRNANGGPHRVVKTLPLS
eukprot:208023_1